MQRISKLTLNNFKFFYQQFEIDFERKNILLYGENGSGKSSIYWALYTFFQSVFKKEYEIQKYFDQHKPENLINRFSVNKQESSIIVEFEKNDGTKTIKEISFGKINTTNDTLIEEATKSSDFINYKLLSRLYDFSNKDFIDLFRIFELEILHFITFRKSFIKHDGTNGSSNAHDWWKYIKPGLNIKPKLRRDSIPHIRFDNAVEDFNKELEFYLNKITETANNFLQKKFKQSLKIGFTYKNCSYDDFIEGSTTKRNHITVPPKIILEVEFVHEKMSNIDSSIERPQSFLNEAKLTTIALSIRFALLKEKLVSEASKILVLDDLLLSLDMSNRDCVLDIILTEFQDFQLFILTHDKLFFEMTRHKINKLNYSDWKYLEMYEKTSDNIPQPLIISSESYLEKAEKFLIMKEYETSANFLRKETESFCKEFLPLKKHYTQDFSLHNLSGLITQSLNFASENGLNTVLFRELDGHRKFVLNPSSHDSYEVPKFYSEIEKCLETIKKLRQIKFESVFKKNDMLEFELSSGEDTYKFEITIQDDFRLIKEPKEPFILTKGMINYRIFKNGKPTKKELQHEVQSIKKMYEDNFEKSDKSKSSNFWEEVFFSNTKEKLKTIIKI